jgi:hypothetical protein
LLPLWLLFYFFVVGDVCGGLKCDKVVHFGDDGDASVMIEDELVAGGSFQSDNLSDFQVGVFLD